MNRAKSKTTGKPLTSTSEERAARRARAALVNAQAERAIDTQRARLERPAANDNADPRWRGNLPVLHNIAKSDPDGALAVQVWGRSSEDAIFGDEDALELDADGEPVEMHVERRHKIRPSINHMLADLLRVRVVIMRTADGRRLVHRVDGMATRPTFDGPFAYMAGMTFNYDKNARRSPAGGIMVGYTDRDGVERQPFYDTAEPRGGNDDGRRQKEGVTRPVCLPQELCQPDVSTEAAEVLEMVLAGSNWREIGEAIGYSEHYADRGAKAKVAAAVSEAKANFLPPRRKADNDNRLPAKAAA